MPGMQIDQFVMARLQKEPTTTLELRRLVLERFKHSRGLAAVLEALRRFRVVKVENHGDRECRELWTWVGLDSPLGTFKAIDLKVGEIGRRKGKKQ